MVPFESNGLGSGALESGTQPSASEPSEACGVKCSIEVGRQVSFTAQIK